MDKQNYKEILKKGEQYLIKNDFEGFFEDENIFPPKPFPYQDFVQILLDNNYTDFLNYMTYIPEYLFYKCSYNRTLVIPSNIKKIGTQAFYRSKIPNIVLSEGLEAIYPDAFSRSTIKKIKIPESCTNIWSESFYGCTDLTDIYLPKSLVNIHPNFIDYREDQKIHSLNNVEDFNFIKYSDKEKFEKCLVK